MFFPALLILFLLKACCTPENTNIYTYIFRIQDPVTSSCDNLEENRGRNCCAFHKYKNVLVTDHKKDICEIKSTLEPIKGHLNYFIEIISKHGIKNFPVNSKEKALSICLKCYLKTTKRNSEKIENYRHCEYYCSNPSIRGRFAQVLDKKKIQRIIFQGFDVLSSSYGVITFLFFTEDLKPYYCILDKNYKPVFMLISEQDESIEFETIDNANRLKTKSNDRTVNTSSNDKVDITDFKYRLTISMPLMIPFVENNRIRMTLKGVMKIIEDYKKYHLNHEDSDLTIKNYGKDIKFTGSGAFKPYTPRDLRKPISESLFKSPSPSKKSTETSFTPIDSDNLVYVDSENN
jgi:hypothetical protein